MGRRSRDRSSGNVSLGAVTDCGFRPSDGNIAPSSDLLQPGTTVPGYVINCTTIHEDSRSLSSPCRQSVIFPLVCGDRPLQWRFLLLFVPFPGATVLIIGEIVLSGVLLNRQTLPLMRRICRSMLGDNQLMPLKIDDWRGGAIPFGWHWQRYATTFCTPDLAVTLLTSVPITILEDASGGVGALPAGRRPRRRSTDSCRASSCPTL